MKEKKAAVYSTSVVCLPFLLLLSIFSLLTKCFSQKMQINSRNSEFLKVNEKSPSLIQLRSEFRQVKEKALP